MDKRPMGYVPGKGNPLDKKPPPNKKYSNVKSKLEGKTGTTVKDVQLMSDQHVAKRKGELFGRIKPVTITRLLQLENNQESIYDMGQDGEEEKINQQMQQQMHINDQESVYSFVTAQTQVTQVSQITQANDQIGISDETNYLLLDLRDADDFAKFHIRESFNYPKIDLSRDKYMPSLYKFKNKENKLIIAYHIDERNGTPLLKVLCEKGYENVYLLTGGIESFMQEFPQYIEGTQIPNIPQLQPGDKKKKLVKRSQQAPGKQGEFSKDVKGDTVANNIIQNQQSQTHSIANQSDIQSVSQVPNVALNKKTLQQLPQQQQRKY